jgi:hypothetical protein
MSAVTCAWCGAVADGGAPPLTWSTSLERGAVRHYCDRCSREHVRDIEGKLDSAWWSAP